MYRLRMKAHPLADVFPMLEGIEAEALVLSMRTNGFDPSFPIVEYEGKILDGRNRYAAAKKAGVAPLINPYRGKDPAGFVVLANIARRHLNESQRAMVGARLMVMFEAEAKERQREGGGDRKSGKANLPEAIPSAGQSREKAAALVHVSARSVQSAANVIESAAPDLISAVDNGTIAVSAAAQLTKKPDAERKEILSRVRSGVSPQEARREMLSAKAAEAGKLPETKYRVVYADPPWSYGNSMPPGTTEPTDHYPTMKLADICAIPVRSIVEDNAVLFMWTTSPLLEEAFEVIRSWGFAYKSSFVWDKVKHNVAHYNSMRHEFLLVGTRGSCQPDVRKLFDSVVTEERTTHSRKPEAFREIIDTIYPVGKRVELFRRGERVGQWDVWGNEVTNAG